MHGLKADLEGVRRLADALGRQPLSAEVVICPPATLLAATAEILAGTAVACGGQTCHPGAEGAFTGEISAPMLRDAGARYVIVGHSERRAAARQSVAQVAASSPASVLYGGSVSAASAGEILSVGSVAGLLVGRACLDWMEFLQIIRAADAARNLLPA